MNTTAVATLSPSNSAPLVPQTATPAKRTRKATLSASAGFTNTTAERDRLITEHMHLVDAAVVRMMRSYGRHLDRDELASFGRKGLFDAARRYEAKKGTPFAAFAFYRIRGAMLDGLRATSAYSRYDVARFNRAEKLRADQRVNELLEDKLRAEGAPPEQSASVAATLESIAETLAEVATVQVVSFEDIHASKRKRRGDDVESGAGADYFTMQFEADATAAPDALYEEASERRVLRQRLERAIATLPPAERNLIELHYFADQDLRDIRGPLGMSKWNLSRLHSRAIRMLRTALSETAELEPTF